MVETLSEPQRAKERLAEYFAVVGLPDDHHALTPYTECKPIHLYFCVFSELTCGIMLNRRDGKMRSYRGKKETVGSEGRPLSRQGVRTT